MSPNDQKREEMLVSSEAVVAMPFPYGWYRMSGDLPHRHEEECFVLFSRDGKISGQHAYLKFDGAFSVIGML